MSVLLPRDPLLPRGQPTLWYDTNRGGAPLHGGRARRAVQAPLDVTPTFQRGGTIVPRRERVRRSALLAVYDPLTLAVAPTAAGAATGSLYLDDGESAVGDVQGAVGDVQGAVGDEQSAVGDGQSAFARAARLRLQLRVQP